MSMGQYAFLSALAPFGASWFALEKQHGMLRAVCYSVIWPLLQYVLDRCSHCKHFSNLGVLVSGLKAFYCVIVFSVSAPLLRRDH